MERPPALHWTNPLRNVTDSTKILEIRPPGVHVKFPPWTPADVDAASNAALKSLI